MKHLTNYLVISIIMLATISYTACSNNLESPKIEPLATNALEVTPDSKSAKVSLNDTDTLTKPSLLLFVSSG
ncbi:MAG: hypothetical protein ACJ0BE_00040 [Dehalococcoidia bacterium]